MKNRFWRAALFWAASLSAVYGAEDSGGIGAARPLEEARFNELSRLLHEHHIQFETRALFERYGAYGSSIRIALDAKGAAVNDDPAQKIVLALPLSPINDDGGAPHFGFMMMTQLLSLAAREESHSALDIVFLADAWDISAGVKTHRGFEELLDSLDDPDNTIILYADMPAPYTELLFIQGGGARAAPLELLYPLLTLCGAYQTPFSFLTKYAFLYKYALTQTPPPLAMAAGRGVPFLYIRSVYQPKNVSSVDYGGDVLAERTARMFWEWTQEVSRGSAVKEYTKNYAITILGKTVFFIPEKIIVFSLLFFGTLLLFVIILLYRYTAAQYKIFFLIALLFIITSFILGLSLDIVLGIFIMQGFLLLSCAAFFYVKYLKRNNALTGLLPKRGAKYAPLFIGGFIFIIPFLGILRSGIESVSQKNAPGLPLREAGGLMPEAASGDFSVTAESAFFLERRIITLDIAFHGRPIRYAVALMMDEDSFSLPYTGDHRGVPFVYAAPVPFTITRDGIEFMLGLFPPEELQLEITLSPEIRGRFVISVYDEQRRVAVREIDL